MRAIILALVAGLSLASVARAATVDLNAAVPASATATIAGFSPTDIINLSLVDNRASGGFAAWNAWGVTNCTEPAGCGSEFTGWLNVFTVSPDGGLAIVIGTGLRYQTPEQALAAFVPAQITGATSYTFDITDSTFGDNLGGLSISYAVATVPLPATAPLLALAVASVGWRLGRRRG